MAESKFNILVVEDDDQVFKDLKNALVDQRYKIWRVTTGKEALKLIKETLFVMVITEIRLKDMKGAKLIEKIVEKDSKISVVALIAYSFVQSGVDALKAGAYMYLTKPINSEEVKIVTKKAVKNMCLLIQAERRQYYQDMAIFDGLTGVYNHRYFHQRLSWHIEHMRRNPQTCSLFMIDIDDFKKYNDTKGHPEGDKVLHNTAQLLLNGTRGSDSVFRYGGEEFAIIMPRTTRKDAKIVGERLNKMSEAKLPVTFSIGLASIPGDAQKKSELIRNADKALYRAKETGKNKLCLYDPKVDK
jgi:diguanylate cyclase (GGDEF)-like protein